VDAVVTASGLRTPAIRIVREGRILPASSFTRAASIAGQALTGLVDARRVLDEVRGGATVVLQGLHRYWPPLTDLITALERELGHPCQANAYLTPAGSQGFAPHRDTHDVFVVQSEGAKTWRLGEEGEEEEVELHPGRVLYLPTGTRHSARAQDDLSLHVTIGINQFTWRGLVRRALLASLDEIEDGHLPAGWLDDPTEVLEGLRQRLAAVAEQLATSDPTTVVVAHEQDFLTSRPPRLAGGLVDALRGGRCGRRHPFAAPLHEHRGAAWRPGQWAAPVARRSHGGHARVAATRDGADPRVAAVPTGRSGRDPRSTEPNRPVSQAHP
jgi:lysine-specific demethylase/histidyl-hydroxylase NO66